MDKGDKVTQEEKAGSQEQSLSLAFDKQFYLSSACFLFLWIWLCWEGLVSVIDIWYGNEIFNHGFFIIPGALYLIYLKKEALLASPKSTSSLSLALIIPAILLYAVGIAGDVQLFTHTATFTLLPALIWLLIGDVAAKKIFFPLCFMLFSIPVGEQLIPYLQEIAATGSVALLNLTGIPLFRSGLYIEIPQGRFLVAEACSGVSFFIASFVIGSLYAYLNLHSFKRKIIFVFISLIFPVVANVVRVYGIILIAYSTDMEYAAGADHLIYGWFFFAFVIICLLCIGELMRDAQSKVNDDSAFYKKVENRKFVLLTVFLILVASITWTNWLMHNTMKESQQGDPIFSHLSNGYLCTPSKEWQPILNKPTYQATKGIQASDECVTVVYAWYDGIDNELVSSLNRSFSPDMWSRESANSFDNIKIANTSIEVTKLASPFGKTRFVTKWFVINEKVFRRDLEAKLYQIYLVFLGQPISGSLIFVSSENQEQLAEAISTLYH